MCTCVCEHKCARYVFSCHAQHSHLCILKLERTRCICVLCMCLCVSCRWYFPRAPCYAGQLLHPSCFDSSVPPPQNTPGDPRHTQHSRSVHEFPCVTAMTATLSEHMRTQTGHKYSHALLTLTCVECQHPHNANEIPFFHSI